MERNRKEKIEPPRRQENIEQREVKGCYGR